MRLSCLPANDKNLGDLREQFLELNQVATRTRESVLGLVLERYGNAREDRSSSRGVVGLRNARDGDEFVCELDGVCLFDKVFWLRPIVGMEVDEPRPVNGPVWFEEFENRVCLELIVGRLRMVVEGEKSAV